MDSLMDRMIAAGVDIHNFQEVFNFYHSQFGGGGTGLGEDQVLQLFQQWGQDKISTAQLQQAIADLAKNSDISRLERDLATKAELTQGLNQKINRGEIQQHFKGVFLSYSALKNAVINPQAGDYAHVDAGIGENAQIYIWDASDADWVKQVSGGASVSSSDDVIEGNQNLYFTQQRVLDTVQPILGDIEAILDHILGDAP